MSLDHNSSIAYGIPINVSKLLSLDSGILQELTQTRDYDYDPAANTVVFKIKESAVINPPDHATIQITKSLSSKLSHLTYVDIRDALRFVGFSDIADASDDEVSAFVVSLIKEGHRE